jgi:PHP family Zn ribbon phosphoesterase
MRIAADLHIHSTLSPCGSLENTPRAIVDRALELQLDMIAITDHNSVENALLAHDYGEARGLSVICGMEAQTSEDVHLLCLMPSPTEAESFYSRVYPFLPALENNPEYFGDQVVVDCDDTIVRIEPKLLLNSLTLTIRALVGLVREYGGVVIPAHVECPHSSLLANLGFLPPELEGCPLEISYCTPLSTAVAAHPELAGRRLLCNSDAHYLADIGRAYTVYDVDKASLASVYQSAQSGRYSVVYGKG